MKIDFYNRQRRFVLDLAEFAADADALSTALKDQLLAKPAKTWQVSLSTPLIEQIFEQSSLSVVLLSDRAIRKLNNDYRDIDKATDVLSFPLDLTCPAVGDWLLGELFISVERAAQQAEDYGHSMRRELAFLFAHGLLHVLGFDHESKGDEKEMFGYQNKILELSGINR